MKNRISALDGLRGLAALSVVIYHYTFRYNELYSHDYINELLFSWGHYGVDLFFIISGFVIFYSASKGGNLKKFIEARFFRLYPTYWVSMLLTFITVSLYQLQGRVVDIKTAFLNLIMFQNYLGIKSVDGVYWTLAIELNFYFWIGLAVYFKKLKNFVYISSLICLLSVFTHNSQFIFAKVFNVLLFTYYLPYFVFGMSIFLLKMNNDLRQGWFGIFSTITCILLARNSIDDVFASIICFSLFIVVIKYDFNIFSKGFLKFFGVISYPLYLLHQNIGYVIIQYSVTKGISEWWAILIAFLSSVILAWGIHELISNKLTLSMKNMYSKSVYPNAG
ncbi:acyltransferase [Colwellia sp. MB3u-4]|uniref:acyltransferase family protein n=1 Tax=Colwellia sp. MB3u-4 TaxID=2759822 RepID=UPI0015F4C1AA|nr:acyltransferase [Colwellia sp. MB3u-4]MBA6288679.1 acyltransferase [Colwellia sp. MB3u-4]